MSNEIPAKVSDVFDPSRWRTVSGFDDFQDMTYHRQVERSTDGEVVRDLPTVRIAFDRPEVRNAFRPGVPASVKVELGGIRLGMLICYDVEFPENVRRLALAGADLVVVPTALPKGSSGTFIANHMIQVRAFENQVFVAYINHCGADDHFTYAGLSRIAAPDGKLLAEAPAEGETLLFAEIRPEDYAKSRAENTYLVDLGRPA